MDKYSRLRKNYNEYIKYEQELLNLEIREKVTTFLLRYISAESFYKKLLIIKIEEERGEKLTQKEINYLQVKADEVYKVLGFLGIKYEREMILRIFGSRDNSYQDCSIKKLRNRFVHSINSNAINAILSRYDSIIEDIDNFMKLFN